MRKRSLQDDLADLATTAPATELDLDAEDLGEVATLAESADEAHVQPSRKRAKRVREKLFRLRAGIDLNNEEYEGRKTTRARAFQDPLAGDEERNLLTADSEDDVISKSSEIASDQDPIHREDTSNTQSSEEGEDGAARVGRNDTATVMDSPSNLDRMHDGTEAARAGSPQLSAPDVEGTAMMRIKARISRDRARAAAVQHQQAIWERLLEFRILLQQMIVATHQLPPSAAMPLVRDASGPGVRQELCSASEDLQTVVSDFIGLHGVMVTQIPEMQPASDAQTGADPEDSGDPSRLEALWRRVDECCSATHSYRDSSLDRWYRKHLLGSGQAALKGNLRLLDHSISVQVANLMRTRERQARKSQLPLLDAPRQLGIRGGSGAKSTAGTESRASNDGRQPATDPERYDDGDFYQQLLREFLEASHAPGAALVAAGTQQRRKAKDVRDRRASKGRRLRYDVQAKLVNFMVPRAFEEPPMASQLLNNLFGHKAR